jgi:hypothetical protein
MLEREEMAQTIQAVTQNALVQFTTEAISKLLKDLHYEVDPNMMAVQVVCLALYNQARQKRITTVTGEMLSPAGLGEVNEILGRDFDLGQKLKQPAYGDQSLAKAILAQLVHSDGKLSRPVNDEILFLRVPAPRQAIQQTLDQLEEDGIVISEVFQVKRIYEWTHEALADQLDWFGDEDQRLRKLEEIIERAGDGLLPRRAERGGLEDLSQARDRGTLKLLPAQWIQIFQSSLETGYEYEAWAASCEDQSLLLKALSLPYMTSPARRRAAKLLGKTSVRTDEVGERARKLLLHWATTDDSSEVRKTASLELAPIINASELTEAFGTREASLDGKAIEALAIIHDRSGISFSSFPADTYRRVLLQTINDYSLPLTASALKCGIAVSMGFVIVAWVNWYNNILRVNPDPLNWLTMLTAGLLYMFLSLFGSSAIALLRDLILLAGGGRRVSFNILGTMVGALIGMSANLLLFSLFTLAGSPFTLGELVAPILGGGLLGLSIALGWLPATFLKQPGVHTTLKRLQPWIGLFGATIVGSAALYLIKTKLGWWPETSVFLRPWNDMDLWLLGGLLGGFSAIGFNWSRLPLSPKEDPYPADQ